MKHVLLVVVLVASFGAAAALSHRGAAAPALPGGGALPSGAPEPERSGPAPRIVFESKKFDFGLIAHGAVAKGTFRFKNEGAGDLLLNAVRTSCGCTAALPSKRRLAPGESGEITVSFETARKPGGKEKQRYTNFVFVTTNDREERDGGPGVTKLTHEGDVFARYRVVPESGVVLRPFQKGADGPAAVTVTVAPLGGAAPLEGATLSAPAWVVVDGPRPSARGGVGAIEFTVSAAAGAPVGPLDGSISIRTADPQQPVVSVVVRGQVLPAIQVMPPRLITSTDQPPRPITLSAQKPIRILGTEVTADDGGPAPLVVTVAPAPAVPDPAARGRARERVALTVSAAQGVSPRAATGEVKIYLADRETPVVVVPYQQRDAGLMRGELEAQKRAGVRVSPAEVFLGELRSGQEIETGFVVSRAGQEPVDVRDVVATPAGELEARIEPVAAGQAARVIVKARGGRPGPIVGEVRFAPRAGGEPLRVRVSGRTAASVVASPAALYVDGVEGGTVVLSRPDGKPVRIATARDVTGTLEVASTPAGNGVSVKPRAGSAKGPFQGKVAIAVDDPLAGEVSVPVFGEVQ